MELLSETIFRQLWDTRFNWRITEKTKAIRFMMFCGVVLVANIHPGVLFKYCTLTYRYSKTYTGED